MISFINCWIYLRCLIVDLLYRCNRVCILEQDARVGVLRISLWLLLWYLIIHRLDVVASLLAIVEMLADGSIEFRGDLEVSDWSWRVGSGRGGVGDGAGRGGTLLEKEIGFAVGVTCNRWRVLDRRLILLRICLWYSYNWWCLANISRRSRRYRCVLVYRRLRLRFRGNRAPRGARSGRLLPMWRTNRQACLFQVFKSLYTFLESGFGLVKWAACKTLD